MVETVETIQTIDVWVFGPCPRSQAFVRLLLHLRFVWILDKPKPLGVFGVELHSRVHLENRTFADWHFTQPRVTACNNFTSRSKFSWAFICDLLALATASTWNQGQMCNLKWFMMVYVFSKVSIYHVVLLWIFHILQISISGIFERSCGEPWKLKNLSLQPPNQSQLLDFLWTWHLLQAVILLCIPLLLSCSKRRCGRNDSTIIYIQYRCA